MSVYPAKSKCKIFVLTDRRVFASVGVSKDDSEVEVSSGEMQNLSKGYSCLLFATFEN